MIFTIVDVIAAVVDFTIIGLTWFRCRWSVLSQFSTALLMPSVPLLDLVKPSASSAPSEVWVVDSLRDIIPSDAKEGLIKSVLKASMHKGPEHGPIISLNRMQIKRGRDGYIGPMGTKSVFAQAAKAMEVRASYWAYIMLLNRQFFSMICRRYYAPARIFTCALSRRATASSCICRTVCGR